MIPPKLPPKLKKGLRRSPRYLREPFPVSLAELYDNNINPWNSVPRVQGHSRMQRKKSKENAINQSLQSDVLYPDLYASGAKRTEMSIRIKNLLEKEQSESYSVLNVSKDIKFVSMENVEGLGLSEEMGKPNKLQQIIEKQKQNHLYY
eukprot:TRINITY_DN1636_c0_g2_i1.p2 TRINITY_DN1636_c0_g2~~TRINITY_DN1636_c0_g2_i1.p2  ORF type:complete len:148 (-),score=41.96 TRINITY_DN1636_c0_g2_i1:139-582(-)